MSDRPTKPGFGSDFFTPAPADAAGTSDAPSQLLTDEEPTLVTTYHDLAADHEVHTRRTSDPEIMEELSSTHLTDSVPDEEDRATRSWQNSPQPDSPKKPSVRPPPRPLELTTTVRGTGPVVDAARAAIAAARSRDTSPGGLHAPTPLSSLQGVVQQPARSSPPPNADPPTRESTPPDSDQQHRSSIMLGSPDTAAELLSPNRDTDPPPPLDTPVRHSTLSPTGANRSRPAMLVCSGLTVALLVVVVSFQIQGGLQGLPVGWPGRMIVSWVQPNRSPIVHSSPAQPITSPIAQPRPTPAPTVATPTALPPCRLNGSLTAAQAIELGYTETILSEGEARGPNTTICRPEE